MTNNKNSTRYYSSKQEKEVAKKLDGFTTVNSGASNFSAGDVTTEHYLIECKTSMKEVSSFSIKKEWLEKIRQESFFKRKLAGIVAFNFGPKTKNYYVIDENLMQFLLEKTKQDFQEN